MISDLPVPTLREYHKKKKKNESGENRNGQHGFPNAKTRHFPTTLNIQLTLSKFMVPISQESFASRANRENITWQEHFTRVEQITSS